jgi:hypothetical protein
MGVLPTSAKTFFDGAGKARFDLADGSRANEARRGEMNFVCSSIKIERKNFRQPQA